MEARRHGAWDFGHAVQKDSADGPPPWGQVGETRSGAAKERQLGFLKSHTSHCHAATLRPFWLQPVEDSEW